MSNELNLKANRSQDDNAAWKAIVAKYQKSSTPLALWQIAGRGVSRARVHHFSRLRARLIFQGTLGE